MSAVGYAVAHWSDSVTYTAEAHTGSMTLVFKKNQDETIIPDYGEFYAALEWSGDKGEDFGGPYAFGDYGLDLDSYVEDCITGNWGYKKLWVKLENVYPGISVSIPTVALENIGTVPLHINGINIEDPSGELTWEWVLEFPQATTKPYGFFYKDGLVEDNDEYDLHEAVMYVYFGHEEVYQLHEGESEKDEIDIYFLQPLEECEYYYFEIEFLADQWNWVEGYPSVPPV